MVTEQILIVSALKEEFPFEGEFNILYTDVGKINVCIKLLEHLNQNPNIHTIINVGSAAGINCTKNIVLECGNFIEGDLDYPNYVPDTITFNPNLNTLATFDSFQTTLPKRTCNCIDMEGYAIAKICKLKKVNFFCFKYISDIIGDINQDSEWIKNYQKGRFLLKEKVIKLL